MFQKLAHTLTNSGEIEVTALSPGFFAEILTVLFRMAIVKPLAAHILSNDKRSYFVLLYSVPAGIDQQRVTEMRKDLIFHFACIHDFVEKDGTFKMGTSRTFIAVIFDGNHIHCVAVKMTFHRGHELRCFKAG